MLDLIAQLSQNAVRDIFGILGAEIDTDALGTDQLDHLLDLVKKGLAGLVEKQVGFVEEEDHSGLGQIAHFRHGLEKLGEHPQKEGGIKSAVIDQALGIQNVDHTLSAHACCHPVMNVQCGFAEEDVSAFCLKSYQGTHDGAYGSGADPAVFVLEFFGILLHKVEHGLQVLGIHQKQLVLIRNAEDDGQDICLQVVQIQDPGKKDGSHLGNGSAERNSLLSVDVPEGHGIALIGKACLGQAESLDSLLHVGIIRARFHKTGYISLDIRHEYRHAHIGKGLGQDL